MNEIKESDPAMIWGLNHVMLDSIRRSKLHALCVTTSQGTLVPRYLAIYQKTRTTCQFADYAHLLSAQAFHWPRVLFLSQQRGKARLKSLE